MSYLKVMLRWLKSSSILSLHSLLLLLVLIGSLSLAGCSKGPFSLLTGGGPNVAANTQVGKTNNQTIGTSQNVAPSVSVRPKANVRDINQPTNNNKVQADEVKTVVVNEVPFWVLILLVLGWLLPSPNEIGRGIYKLFRKK